MGPVDEGDAAGLTLPGVCHGTGSARPETASTLNDARMQKSLLVLFLISESERRSDRLEALHRTLLVPHN